MAAVNSVAPGKIQSALMYESQPFTTHSLFLPYLTFAPQKALSNIYGTYWRYDIIISSKQGSTMVSMATMSKYVAYLHRTEQALDGLRSEIDDVLDLTTAYGITTNTR